MSTVKYLHHDELLEFEEAQSERLLDTAHSLHVVDDKLDLDGTILKFMSVVEGRRYEKKIDLTDIWVPGSGGFEHPVPLLLYPHHAHTAIRRLDRFAQGVGHTPTFTQGAPKVFVNTVRFIEWALLNDHYLLGSVSERDIKQLHQDLKLGGVQLMLQIPQRLDAYWEFIKNDQAVIKDIISFAYGGVDSINTGRLSKQIGSAGLIKTIPSSFYRKIAGKLREKGDTKIRERFVKAGNEDITQPAAKTLNTLFTQWNELARLDDGDHLNIFPFPDPYLLSKELGSASQGTRNLHAEQVVQLLGTAHLWIYKVSPIIIQIVRDLKSAVNREFSTAHNSRKLFTQMLEESANLDELEKLADIKVYRGGANSGRNVEDNEWTVTECISALMSACFIVLQTYNARRKSEIQDPVIGISKPAHFRCVDDVHDWYQACFYNEKHGGRYWYTLNSGSTKALQVLFELKDAWDTVNTQGLFNIPSFILDDGYNIKPYKFNYNKGKNYRFTGDKFLRLALGDKWEYAKGTHVFRRIYAIIYYYQYENRELLSLCHQLGHVDPDVTQIYVTEPAAREQHEQLHHKIKLNNDERSETIILIKEENKALDKMIADVDIEKTSEDILGLLMGTKSMAGRYPAFLKRVFKVLSKSVEFNKHMNSRHEANFIDLTPEQQSEEMSQVIFQRGHRNNQKPHNACHRDPCTPRPHDAPCEPLTCKGCPYQEVKQSHLDIMAEDLIELREVADNDHNDLLERMRAEETADCLELIITHHQRTMDRNQNLFSS